jgi:uncharacterized protein YjdB
VGKTKIVVSAKLKAVTKVAVAKKTLALTAGGAAPATAVIKAKVSPAKAKYKTVTWTSSAPKVATVSKQGKVTAVAKGTAVITVTTRDGSKKAKVTVTVG